MNEISGENVPATLKREFMEEVLSVESSSIVESFFNDNGKEIYKGYVDDPRNTGKELDKNISTILLKILKIFR